MDGGWIWSLPKETTEECHTKTLASFGEVGLLRQDLNNSEDENEKVGQSLLKETKNHEESQINCMVSFTEDGYLRQNLNNSEDEATFIKEGETICS